MRNGDMHTRTNENDTSREVVRRAIEFRRPARVPVWFFNRDHMRGDILVYPLCMADGARSEWGYEMVTLDDGTMGQPSDPVIPSWDALDAFAFPELRSEMRMEGVSEFVAQAGDRYRLGTLGISGFNLYTFLRGFENSMADFALEKQLSGQLLDKIFAFECELFTLAAQHGLDGVHLSDDWGSQDGLLISPALWREIFRPRYEAQFAHAHGLGLHVWFHSCGNIAPIVNDIHEIGVDVLNISQPNVVDIERVGADLRGRQCFMVPISYQTVSISGTPTDIRREAERLHRCLGSKAGGFIGYVEEYSCMGMSEENYQACARVFFDLQNRDNDERAK